MPRLYFAAPLFSAAELVFNAVLVERIEALGFDVFLPQRDGVEASREPWASMAPKDRQRAVFETHRDQVFACDVLLFVLDGRVPDEGAALELGLAYAHRQLAKPGRRLVGLHTDAHAAFPDAKLNEMLSGALDVVFEDADALLGYLAGIR
ncbi:MAG TPA: nucleoside 2-deoxyribosyltransferase domain-containing protein [Inquilinus sp.]|nr:nucleoside 2-deoxyribosyltransferase domain-containing protein [Inquilinus sp.]